jgi:hypothetical protein
MKDTEMTSQDVRIDVKKGVKGVSPRISKKKVQLDGSPSLGSGPGVETNFIYRGGRVINNPQVYMMFLGDWTSAANQTRATRLSQFMNDMMNSDYMNMLAQYGVGNTGTVANSVFISSADHDLNRTDIESIFQTAINNNTIPEPTNQSSVYLLFLDDATGVSGTFGTDSIGMCEPTNDSAFGFHFHFNTAGGNELFYAVIPGLTDTCLANSCPGGDATCSLQTTQTREQRQTQVLSHEFSEMITNPDVEGNEGWSNSSGFHENGDICNGQPGSLTVGSNTWNVQMMYSKWDDMQTNGATICVLGSSFPLPSLLPSCTINIDKSSYGKDEVDAFLNGPSHSPAVFDAAFYVVVDGYTATQLGITNASFSGTPNIKPTITPISGMQFIATSLSAPDQSQLNIIQPFTWIYTVKFTNDASFPTTPGTTVPVTINASISSVISPILNANGSADIVLIDEPNPFEMDGPISWLSTDLRVFQVKSGDAKFGETMGNTAADAPTFIQNVIDRLNSGNTAGQTFENNITLDENVSALELSEKVNNVPIFNFAVAKVHYRALNVDSGTVRVFFRLFPGSTTSTAYTPSLYPRGGQGGVIIPLLGIAGGETTTIPCFADARKNYSTHSLNEQTDVKNVQVLAHNTSGDETIAYFGCWLDINQPSQPQFPVHPSSNAGPYNVADQKTIQDLIRNVHQCLVAEVSLDGVTLINNGETPGSSDKLAQRNLTIVESDNPGSIASHRIPTTFEVKPTALKQKNGTRPDELLVDWGNTPSDSTASFYFPGAAKRIVEMASSTYSKHNLSVLDQDTIQCPTKGITYIPVPEGPGPNIPGMLTVDLPGTVKKGQAFKVVVRQLTNAAGRLIVRQPVTNRKKGSPAIAAENLSFIQWRKVTGSFQLSIPVRTKDVIIESEERLLSVLRYIQKSIPASNRWEPVFNKYVQQIADRVEAFGGDPAKILPTPDGNWQQEGEKGKERREAFSGKIAGIIYNHFGNFEGFYLETEDGERKFKSREHAMEDVVKGAWLERIFVTVYAEKHEPEVPLSIILRRPPNVFNVN